MFLALTVILDGILKGAHGARTLSINNKHDSLVVDHYF